MGSDGSVAIEKSTIPVMNALLLFAFYYKIYYKNGRKKLFILRFSGSFLIVWCPLPDSNRDDY